jgi:hypothetical protein
MPETLLLNRIRAEYLEMPGLLLTREQMQRLYGVDRTECQPVLDALVDARFLCVRSGGAYARLTEGMDAPRPQPVQAALREEPSKAP